MIESISYQIQDIYIYSSLDIIIIFNFLKIFLLFNLQTVYFFINQFFAFFCCLVKLNYFVSLLFIFEFNFYCSFCF